jgi:hypothetical protein
MSQEDSSTRDPWEDDLGVDVAVGEPGGPGLEETVGRRWEPVKCQLCEAAPGTRYVQIRKPSGGTFLLWCCDQDALWLAAPAGIDVVPNV